MALRGQFGQSIDFRPTARHDAKAARAFLKQTRETVHLYHPLTIITDKAHSYAKVIGEINDRLGSEDVIQRLDLKYLDNLIESAHATQKQRLRDLVL